MFWQALAQQWPWFFPLLAVVLGGVFGSFLSCALYRVPRGQSLRRPPSHCPQCGVKLWLPDLVPVLSWVLSGGRCRHCSKKIPGTYFATEVLSIALALLALGASNILSAPPFSFLLLYGFMASVFFVGVVYIKHRQPAPKSVAFGLLCLGSYVAFLFS